MSRLARIPLDVPAGTQVKEENSFMVVTGALGELKTKISDNVKITFEDNKLHFSIAKDENNVKAMLGTIRSLVQNMIVGCSQGFTKTLKLQGVGYRAKVTADKLDLVLGYSHPVVYNVPTGITITTPDQTEIVIKGIDKQLVGQVAANIRSLRAPEPYKGKGIRYSDEVIIRKEVKKK